MLCDFPIPWTAHMSTLESQSVMCNKEAAPTFWTLCMVLCTLWQDYVNYLPTCSRRTRFLWPRSKRPAGDRARGLWTWESQPVERARCTRQPWVPWRRRRSNNGCSSRVCVFVCCSCASVWCSRGFMWCASVCAWSVIDCCAAEHARSRDWSERRACSPCSRTADAHCARSM